MSNSIDQYQDQLQTDISSITAQANSQLQTIAGYKAQLLSNLDVVEINYDPTVNAPLSKAVNEIFGSETNSTTEPSLKTITLDMYMTCINVLQAAGKYQGANMVADKIF